MIKQRIATAIVMLGILLGVVVFANEKAFISILFGVGVLAAYEWSRLLKITSIITRIIYIGFFAIIIVCTILAVDLNSFIFLTAPIYLIVWFMISIAEIYYPSHSIINNRYVFPVVSLVTLYAGWVGLYFTFVTMGNWLFLLLVITIALTDTGGYVFGKLFGKYKLAPKLSPGKTIEGVAGGVGGTTTEILYAAALTATYLLAGCGWTDNKDAARIKAPAPMYFTSLKDTANGKSAMIRSASVYSPGQTVVFLD